MLSFIFIPFLLQMDSLPRRGIVRMDPRIPQQSPQQRPPLIYDPLIPNRSQRGIVHMDLGPDNWLLVAPFQTSLDMEPWEALKLQV